MFKYLKAAYFWLLFPILTVLIFFYMTFWEIVAKVIRHPHPDRHIHELSSLWAKCILAFMPGWRLKISGQENLPQPGEAVVAVSNHESMADIWVIFTLKFQFRWLSKSEIFDIILIGTVMKWAGYIPIIRGNKESHVKAMQDSAAWLKQGVSMLFFPEGTRSKTGEMLPFKIGAFKLADESNVAILPIATKGTRDFVRKHGFLPGTATVKLEVLPKEFKKPDETYEEFADRIRSKILARTSLM